MNLLNSSACIIAGEKLLEISYKKPQRNIFYAATKQRKLCMCITEESTDQSFD